MTKKNNPYLSLDATVQRMKSEIIHDIKADIIPIDCPSFSALHDYVDANEYGGFCESDVSVDVGNDVQVEFINKCQNAIHEWISEGCMKRDYESLLDNPQPQSV